MTLAFEIREAALSEVEAAVHGLDPGLLERTDGHFAVMARDDKTIRLARTFGLPLRYFVAKRYHGPFLVVADRMEAIYAYCREQKIGWQFDPLYTRMIPAHYLVEIDQVHLPAEDRAEIDGGFEPFADRRRALQKHRKVDVRFRPGRAPGLGAEQPEGVQPEPPVQLLLARVGIAQRSLGENVSITCR